MATASITEADIISRLVNPTNPDLSPEAAESIIKLDFSVEDIQRMNILSDRAAEGTLGIDEQAELDAYERVGHLLTILKSKARVSLRHSSVSRPSQSDD